MVRRKQGKGSDAGARRKRADTTKAGVEAGVDDGVDDGIDALDDDDLGDDLLEAELPDDDVELTVDVVMASRDLVDEDEEPEDDVEEEAFRRRRRVDDDQEAWEREALGEWRDVMHSYRREYNDY